jgi:hypothetical protein
MSPNNGYSTSPAVALNASDTSVPPQRKLRVALLGAGIYARNQHVPALTKYCHDLYDLQIVWSRNKSSSTNLIQDLHLNSKAMGGDDGLQLILQNPDIDAVSIALPIDVMPQFIPQFVNAGKHVLSEKPIGPTLTVANHSFGTIQQCRPYGLLVKIIDTNLQWSKPNG